MQQVWTKQEANLLTLKAHLQISLILEIRSTLSKTFIALATKEPKQASEKELFLGHRTKGTNIEESQHLLVERII
jgi:hypothetical protein